MSELSFFNTVLISNTQTICLSTGNSYIMSGKDYLISLSVYLGVPWTRMNRIYIGPAEEEINYLQPYNFLDILQNY